MRNAVVGGIYAIPKIEAIFWDTYTVEILDFVTGEEGDVIRQFKCRSLQTGEKFFADTSKISTYESVKEIYNALLKNASTDGMEALDKEFLERLEKILEIADGVKVSSTLLSFLDSEADFTQEDIKLLSNIIDLCLDVHNSDLFDKATNLKNKLILHVSA